MQNNSLNVYVSGSLPDLHYTEVNKEIKLQAASDSVTVLSKVSYYFCLDVERAEQGCSERVENLARYFPLTLLCLHSRVIDPTPHTAAAPPSLFPHICSTPLIKLSVSLLLVTQN